MLCRNRYHSTSSRRYGRPKIFSTDQGSQFTSGDFTDVLKEHDIKTSMDGKGRWRDNDFIERLWRSLKYECVNLQAFVNPDETREGIRDWINFYNDDRPHSSLGDKARMERHSQRVAT